MNRAPKLKVNFKTHLVHDELIPIRPAYGSTQRHLHDLALWILAAFRRGHAGEQ